MLVWSFKFKLKALVVELKQKRPEAVSSQSFLESNSEDILLLNLSIFYIFLQPLVLLP